MRSKIFRIAALSALIAFALTRGATGTEEELSRGDFLVQLADSMGVSYLLDESPSTEDYVKLLRKQGFDIPEGYDTSAAIGKEEKAKLLNQAFSIGRERRVAQRDIREAYRDRAVIIKFSGNVTVRRDGESAWIPAMIDMELSEGDYIKTEAKSSVSLRVGTAGRVEIKENSELLLRTVGTQPDSRAERVLIYLALGEIVVDVRDLDKKSRFETHTPTTVAAVRGTIYAVKVAPTDGKTQILEKE